MKKYGFFVLAFLSSLTIALGQPWRPYKASVLIGPANDIEGLPASSTAIPRPDHMSFGRDGNLYFDSVPSRGLLYIDAEGKLRSRAVSSLFPFAVNADGTVFTFSGPSIFIYPKNGPAIIVTPDVPGTSSRIFADIALDSRGRALVADSRGSRIFRVNALGSYEIVGGLGSPGYLPEAPTRIAIDGSDRIIFAASSGALYAMYPSSPAAPLSTDRVFGAIAAGTDGSVYFVRNGGSAIAVVKDGQTRDHVTGISAIALATDREGRLLAATASPAQAIFRIEADGSRARIAGTDSGPVTETPTIVQAQSVGLGTDGAVYIADTGQNRILKRIVSGGTSVLASGVNQPYRIAVDTNGNVYFVASGTRKVGRISPSGELSDYAGNGNSGSAGDGGPALQASFDSISAIAWTPNGLAIADRTANRIRIVDANGIIRPLAGNGSPGFVMDGAVGTESPVYDPDALTADREGNLVFRARGFREFVRLNVAGKLVKLPNYSPGDAAAQERCNFNGGLPSMAIDSTNSIVAATGNAICRIDTNGKVWLVAADVTSVSGLAMDSEDRIYATDTTRNRLYLLEPSGFTEAYPSIPQPALAVGSGLSKSPSVTAFSPGALMSVFGEGFTADDVSRPVTAADLGPSGLPTRLADTCVEVGGVRAPLTFVSSRQINFQAPSGVGTSTTLSVVTNCDTPRSITSPTLSVSYAAASPEFLYWSATSNPRPVVAVEATTQALLAPRNTFSFTTRPARPNEVIVIYAISMGDTNPAIPVGRAASGPASVRGEFRLFLNNQQVSSSAILYAGASPGTAGLYQINLRVPDLPDGTYRISMSVGNATSPSDGALTIQR